VALVSYVFFEYFGVVYYLLGGVLAGNIWEAWRRVNRRGGRSFPRGIGRFLRELSPWRDIHGRHSAHGHRRELPTTIHNSCEPFS